MSKSTQLKGPHDKQFLKLIKPIETHLHAENDQNKLLNEQLESLTETLDSSNQELRSRRTMIMSIQEKIWSLQEAHDALHQHQQHTTAPSGGSGGSGGSSSGHRSKSSKEKSKKERRLIVIDKRKHVKRHNDFVKEIERSLQELNTLLHATTPSSLLQDVHSSSDSSRRRSSATKVKKNNYIYRIKRKKDVPDLGRKKIGLPLMLSAVAPLSLSLSHTHNTQHTTHNTQHSDCVLHTSSLSFSLFVSRRQKQPLRPVPLHVCRLPVRC